MAVEENTISIFSVYAPQIGCPDEDKKRFWSNLQEETEKVEAKEKCIDGGDLNGHVVQKNDVISQVHGGYGHEEENAEGKRIIDSAVLCDMEVANIFFDKRREHLIIYTSGGGACQINFLLCRRKYLIEIKDCKVILGDHVTVQHRLVVMDLIMGVEQSRKKEITRTKKI